MVLARRTGCDEVSIAESAARPHTEHRHCGRGDALGAILAAGGHCALAGRAEQDITLFGTDLTGMDDPDEWWWSTHWVWLDAEICMVHQMRNLDWLQGKEFKLRDGTGCPVRPIALMT